jgi:hypothetical protein
MCVCVGVAANIFEFLMADLDEINSLHRFTQTALSLVGIFFVASDFLWILQ